MTLSRRGQAIALIVVLASVASVPLSGCASGSGQRQPRDMTLSAASAEPAAVPVPGLQVSPGQFVSLRLASSAGQSSGPSGSLDVALSDVRTGAVVRRLLPATTSTGMSVSGLALDRAGDLWITYSKGPDYAGDTASGDPQPHTCASQIDVVHAGTGRVTVFLRTGNNTLISDARPSPDGTELVYTESACIAYFDSYLRVTDLRTSRSWTIAQALPACHLLTGPAWSADARTLLVDYGPDSQPGGPVQGPCPQWWAGRLVRVDAGVAQSGLSGTSIRADPGCQTDAVAGDADGGMLAVEECGTAPEYLNGPADLLVLDNSSRAVRRFPLGDCADGSGIAVDQAGTSALISAYMNCGPGGSGPVTRLWEYADGRLRPVTSISGETGGALTMLAWP
jgi:hypothetical protein